MDTISMDTGGFVLMAVLFVGIGALLGCLIYSLVLDVKAAIAKRKQTQDDLVRAVAEKAHQDEELIRTMIALMHEAKEASGTAPPQPAPDRK